MGVREEGGHSLYLTVYLCLCHIQTRPTEHSLEGVHVKRHPAITEQHSISLLNEPFMLVSKFIIYVFLLVQ